MSSDKPVIMFLCVHNAGRSQIAAAFARRRGGDRITVLSAGSAPGETLNPMVVAAMKELDLDISKESPKELTNAMAESADVIVTMGCGDACPFYPKKRYLDWELDDPAGQSLEAVRIIRSKIEGRVAQLIDELLAGTAHDS